MPRIRRSLLAAAALLASATLAGAQGSVPSGYQVTSRTPLGAGVEHDVLTLPGTESVQVARMGPGAASLAAVSSHDAIAHGVADQELPSDMCRRTACLAGINADFHDAATGEPLGGVVSGGRLLRSPVPGRDQLIITRDGHLQAGPLDWSGSVTGSDNTSVALGGVNSARQGGVVLYTPAWGPATPDGADTELVLRATAPLGTFGGSTPVEIVGVRSDGATEIPADGAVLSASGSAAAVLHDLGARADAGVISHTMQLRFRSTVDVVQSLGGLPVLLRDGHPAYPDADDTFTRSQRPRSLVGWNPAGEVMLVTVDGGRDDAKGLTLAEAADLLVGLGATDGLGFDGAAATFVVGGEVTNLPVDDMEPGVPAPTEGREVAPGHMERPAVSSLVIVPKGAAPVPAPSTPAGSGGTGSGATATTTSPRVTPAGSGGPAPKGALVPVTPVAGSGAPLPTTVDQILRNPTTKRGHRQGGGKKGGKSKGAGKAGDSQESVADDSTAGDGWYDPTISAVPDASAPTAGDTPGLALAVGSEHSPHPLGEVGALLLQLIAAGMVVTVLAGLQRARRDSRPRPALWL